MIFNPKTLANHLPASPEIPEAHRVILENWVELIRNGALAKQNEIEVHAPFTSQIMCQLLGYHSIGQAETYTVAREYPVARGKVDLALGHFSGDKTSEQVIAPFELKGARTNLDAMMSGRHKTPVQQAFDYARDLRGVNWVLLSNYVELRLYCVAETSLVYEQFRFEDMLDPAEYARFQLLLGSDNFLSGKTDVLLAESNSADKDISDKLYQDYKTLRQNMLRDLIQDNSSHSPQALIAPAQKLLDRVLFVSFAEDKGLIPANSIKQAFEHSDPYHPRPTYQNFVGLFEAINRGNAALNIPAYNGGLFAEDELLDDLQVSDALCERFKQLAEYDFDSEVSVTVLGHIFEQSISDLEKLVKTIAQGEMPEPARKATSVSGKRKLDGVVFTPNHITRFIVQNTLGRYLADAFDALFAEYGKYKKDGSVQWKRGSKTELRFWYAWQEKLKEIKVVDPACGSGAFLVAAFDYLHAEYETCNNHIAELTGQRSVLDLNKTVLTNNLFGVDKNPESVEISKLSLWLKTAERGKPLTSLDDNIKTGNSLGFEELAPDSSFVWRNAFAEIFAQGGFDVVLGNPPYVRQEYLGEIKPWLEQYFDVYHGVLDLYGYFFELGIKLLKPAGRMAYISSSSFFKTSSGTRLRKLLAETVSLDKIVDFGDLQVFEGVTTYPAIVVLKKAAPEQEHKTQILQLADTLPADLQTTFEREHGLMVQTQLGADSWQLEDERIHALRQKLTEGRPTLKEVYGSPYRGVLTGFNEAFVINRETRDALISENTASAELIKPFLEGKDLKKWHAQSRDKWLIFTRRGVKLGNYPAIKRYLEQYEERLTPKPRGWPKGEKWGGRKGGSYQWYEIQDTVDYFESFSLPKIQYAHFSPEPLFHLNRQSDFSNDKSYIIPADAPFVLGLLNSKLYWFLIRALCPFVRGGYYELRAQYIETLPVPEVDDDIAKLAGLIQAFAEERYAVEKNFARRLRDLCPSEQAFKINKKLQSWWQLDFAGLQAEIKKSFKATIPLAERDEWQDYFEAEQQKRAELNAKIERLEAVLDDWVYDLFELTEDEIRLIDPEYQPAKPYDPYLSFEQNEMLDKEIQRLMAQGLSESQALEMAPIGLGFREGCIIEVEE